MFSKGGLRANRKVRSSFRLSRRAALHLGLGLSACLATSGCLSSLNRHAASLSVATAPVVDGAALAYRGAQTLHDRRVDYGSVAAFDQADPVYNPRLIQPLLSEQGIQVRLSVLAAFEAYTKYVVDIADGTNSKPLEEACASVGHHLAGMGNLLAPSIRATLGIAQASASSTTTTVTTTAGDTTISKTSTAANAPPALITPDIQQGIGSAVDALAQFLVRKKIKRELPLAIADMDQHLQLLTKLLQEDLATLQDQEDRDYNFIINRQTLFIREGSQLNAQQRREEIMKLPQIVRQERASDEQLAALQAAIGHLATVHKALADEEKNASPESLKMKLQELAAAGGNLAHPHSSLPAQ